MKTLLFIIGLLIPFAFFAQGTETFTNISTNSSSYSTVNWTGDNGLAWSSTDSRTDQSINGKAIGLRFGKVSCNNIPNGVGSISFKYKYLFTTGGNANLVVKINGSSIGSLTVQPSETNVQTASFNNINIAGTFNFEIEETVSGPRVAIDDIVWTAYSNTPCVTPTATPTNLVFGTISNNSISGSFTAAAPAADEYLVVRSTSNNLGATPVHGTVYDESDQLGNGVVVSRSNSTSFTAQSLNSGTTYYFFVFALNANCSGGPLYRTTPLSGNATTTTPAPCTSPTAAPTALSLTASSTSISGSFTASSSADGYLVVRSTNNTLSAVPSNGTTYTEGSSLGGGTVIKFGQGTTFSTTGLTTSTTYYFFVFALNQFNCTGGPLYNSTSLNGNTTTTSGSAGVPSGYYTSIAGKTCADLKTALKTIISNGHVAQGYAALWEQFKVSDIKPREVGSGSTHVIWDIYSDKPNAIDPYNFTPGTNQCGNYSNEGDCYNREHSFPQNWFTGGTSSVQGNDYHHIFPTDGKVNGLRSNYVYGEVAVASTTTANGSKLGSSAVAGITGTVFEPIDEYKGDLARAFLYMVTRYQDNMPTWGNLSGSNGLQALEPNTFPSVDIDYLRLMIKWHNQDPVSQKEIDRNNAAYTYQGNRNPYVDSPQLVTRVWDAACPGLAALPVRKLIFSGKLQAPYMHLQWDVAGEYNLMHYEVERSFNGTQYQSIALIKGIGASTYIHQDNVEAFPGRRVYYRLKQTDRDGSVHYSSIISIHLPLNTKFSVNPNPVKGTMQLSFGKTLQQAFATLSIVDYAGRVISRENVVLNQSTYRYPIQHLSSGMYLVQLQVGKETLQQTILVTQ